MSEADKVTRSELGKALVDGATKYWSMAGSGKRNDPRTFWMKWD
jgi:hypothetical protein